MDDVRQERRPDLLWSALIGIESGVLGGLAMLAWFMLASTLLRQSPWTVPGLLGALLGPDLAPRGGPSWGVVQGLALLIFWAGLLGGLFALATHQVGSRRRLVLLGLLAGTITFYVSNAVIFRKLGALLWVYTSPRSLLVAHLLLGVAWGLRPLPLKPGAGQRPGGDSDRSAGAFS